MKQYEIEAEVVVTVVLNLDAESHQDLYELVENNLPCVTELYDHAISDVMLQRFSVTNEESDMQPHFDIAA